MSLEAISATPVRMTITNLRTAESQPVMANPREIEIAINVAWNEIEIPGQSHTPLQFKNVSNAALPLELYCSEYMLTKDDRGVTLDDHQRFLQSLCYPDFDAADVLEGAPPRVLICWPNVLSLTTVIRSMSFRFTHFATDDLRATRYVASAKVSEIRDVRLSAADVRRQGFRRGFAAGGSGAGRPR